MNNETSTEAAAAATAAVATAANKVTLGSAGVAGLGWLTSSEFLALSGVLFGLVSLLVGWYYKRETKKLQLLNQARKDREQAGRDEERKIRIEVMRKTGIPMHPPKEDTDFGVLEEGE